MFVDKREREEGTSRGQGWEKTDVYREAGGGDEIKQDSNVLNT